MQLSNLYPLDTDALTFMTMPGLRQVITLNANEVLSSERLCDGCRS